MYLSITALYWDNLSFIIHKWTNINCVFIVRIYLYGVSVLEECKHILAYAVLEGSNYCVTVILSNALF